MATETVTQPPDSNTKPAAKLTPGDRIARGFLPTGGASTVVVALPYTHHRADWVLVVHRYDDGRPDGETFLADADIPVEPVADETGLTYTRADTEPDDPTPVSPARVPLHTGAVVDGGALVDETGEASR